MNYPDNKFLHNAKRRLINEGAALSSTDKEKNQHTKEQVKNTLSRFQENREGINISLIENFALSHNFRIPDIYIFSKKDKAKIEEVMISSSYFGIGQSFEDVVAQYDHTSDTIIAYRDLLQEENNKSPVITDSFIVHELTHATVRNYLILESLDVEKSNYDFSVPRRGFFTVKDNEDSERGRILEEAWAEYHRGLYMNNFNDKRKPISIASTNPNLLISIKSPEIPDYEFALPQKYLYYNDLGNKTLALPSFAAYGLELMIQNEPELYSLMQSCRDDPKNLRQLYALMHAKFPLLTKQLRMEKYTQRNVVLFLKEVFETLGKPNQIEFT
jgi:hypothetical protein